MSRRASTKAGYLPLRDAQGRHDRTRMRGLHSRGGGCIIPFFHKPVERVCRSPCRQSLCEIDVALGFGFTDLLLICLLLPASRPSSALSCHGQSGAIGGICRGG